MFLVDGVEYGGDFVVALSEAAVRYEIEHADERSLDDPYWPSGQGTTLGTGLRAETDPLILLMEDLGADARAWRALLIDPTVAHYLFVERRFDTAGFTRLATGAELAAAGPDVVARRSGPAAARRRDGGVGVREQRRRTTGSRSDLGHGGGAPSDATSSRCTRRSWTRSRST